MEENVLNELKKLSILCVEDEDGIRKRLINILSYYFDTIYESSSGNDAYEIYLNAKPDIIFTDIQMINGNGIELIKKIRENDFDVKIVVLTAHSSEEYLYKLINLKIDQYIIKPFNSSKLKETLTHILKERLQSNIELLDGLYLDMSSRELRYKEIVIKIRKRERDFLALLFENKNRCITNYYQIEEVVWNNDTMSMSALKTFVRDLRKKIPVDIIDNIPQEGYCLKK